MLLYPIVSPEAYTYNIKHRFVTVQKVGSIILIFPSAGGPAELAPLAGCFASLGDGDVGVR